MKKVVLLAVFAVVGLTSVNAQEDKKDKDFKEDVNEVVDMAKEGGFYVGANIGISLINSAVTLGNTADDYGSFNFGFDAAYLFEVIPNLEVGLLVGYTQFVASGEYTYFDGDSSDGTIITADFKDASFVPISSSARYYFADRKFFGGLDLGYAINVSGDEGVDGGLYLRPKFGFNLGAVTLIGSFQKVGGGIDYNTSGNVNSYQLDGFNSFNVGVEFGF